jgi:hypothetical protein
MLTTLRASFSFLKVTSRFALLSLPNLPVSGENLNLWAVAALRRRSLLEGIALRQWGWWLSFVLDVLLLVASSHLRWRSSPAVYVSLDGWCCGRRRCSWVAA